MRRPEERGSLAAPVRPERRIRPAVTYSYCPHSDPKSPAAPLVQATAGGASRHARGLRSMTV
ncbi:hypothetical protein SZN_37521, partial [Streptomyces zinciresistens K42]